MILDLFLKRRKKLFCRRVKSAENLPQCEDSQKTIYGINFAYTSSFPPLLLPLLHHFEEFEESFFLFQRFSFQTFGSKWFVSVPSLKMNISTDTFLKICFSSPPHDDESSGGEREPKLKLNLSETFHFYFPASIVFPAIQLKLNLSETFLVPASSVPQPIIQRILNQCKN